MKPNPTDEEIISASRELVKKDKEGGQRLPQTIQDKFAAEDADARALPPE